MLCLQLQVKYLFAIPQTNERPKKLDCHLEEEAQVILSFKGIKRTPAVFILSQPRQRNTILKFIIGVSWHLRNERIKEVSLFYFFKS